MRLDRILANSGHGSRKEVRNLIRSGAITLGETRLTNEAANIVETDWDWLMLHGKALKPQFSFYFALNKPEGYLTAMEDKKQATVKEFLPPNLLSLGLFPVGRLDIDTSGLLLFTNDGTLGHRLTKPEWKIEKHYVFDYAGTQLSDLEVELFKSGLKIGRWQCRPAQLILSSERQAELILEEGKFHQVKRMLAAVGREVTSLKRLRHGPVTLADIEKQGQIRVLQEHEISILYESTDLVRPTR